MYWLNSWPPQPPHIGLSWHGSLEPCLLIPEAIHPFTHFETIKWSQWLLGPDSIGTWREGKPAEIGLNDENYCAQKESIGAFQRNSILLTKGFGRQSENGNATLLGVGAEEVKGGLLCMAIQHLLRTVHLSVMSPRLANHCWVCAERDKTALKWVIVYRQIITAIGRPHFKHASVCTFHKPHSFKSAILKKFNTLKSSAGTADHSCFICFTKNVNAASSDSR